MQLIHSKTFTVTKDHLDELNHVNNVQYVYWVEEAAAEHWNLLKNLTPYKNDFWVLMDHHLQYKKQVFLGEEMTVKTYPENPEGLKQPRRVEFYVNGVLVVDSRTLWVLFDGETKSVKRMASNWLDELKKRVENNS